MKIYTRLAFLLCLYTIPLWGTEYSVIGIGAPCADIIYQIDNEFLNSLPTNKGDCKQASWDVFSSILDRCFDKGYTSLLATGGSGSNTIKGLACLGDKVAFLGKIGEDSLGSFYQEKVSSLGVTPLLIPTKTPTTQIAVLVTEDQQRSFLSFPGAGHELSPEELNPELFNHVKLVHIDGYMLDDIALVEKAMQIAKIKKAKVSLDMACTRIVKNHKQDLLRLINQYVDVVFANEDEIKALTNLTGEEGCQALLKICPIAVILIGNQGCYVGSEGIVFHSPAIKVNAVDTTGAGDLFAAGFLHGYLMNYDLQSCAWLGNLLGGTVVTSLGAEIPNEKWPLLKRQIAEHFTIDP